MSVIQSNISNTLTEIKRLSEKYQRSVNSVQLLAVSKTKPISAIEDAINAGQQHFGENYVQEGVEKIIHFTTVITDNTKKPLTWHFIGPIQSNKTKPIAENFDWVHSVDRLKIAKRLSDQRPESMPALNILIQVNTCQEVSKSGIHIDEIPELAKEIATLPHIQLRGLMAIPQATTDYQQQHQQFLALSNAFSELQQHYPSIDTLSMGMSGDMEAAIETGTTMVRIGTAIFGARDYSK
ncbi:YggS family pyridoxal phosphate-dependent enzyme [Vibrio sp. SS-MA-C1-2]|uniref:YggS family pyridoxal phosphate-dependent enzyme n=1 Tax=Vibrio sp. SS-MA-C1-2 TaxID=2908646 RepID=UPI001F3AE498|nr:YggS family pyridoxal phosphate-dependent enzyme [Vibrio sp. SS-MA-C1-2]UJF19064.1 YggS family pyridoxal phosphate-dependent enzyme [Vibrio sp. SS-MA-C1-2]